MSCKKQIVEDWINGANYMYKVISGDVDEHGNPVSRTKQSHPYSYDGFVLWRGGKNEEANNTVYSDRLYQWDYKKFNKLCFKHFGNEGQYWNNRNHKLIELFLRDYLDNDKLTLIFIMEYCNASNGYPVWRFDFNDGGQK